MQRYFEYLLSDEIKGIDLDDYTERHTIIYALEEEISVEMLGKIRHFQPQIGCLNACSICSKHASTRVEWWTAKRIRNIIAAIKYLALKERKNKPYISWDRDNHRSGVVFSYLDNDIGNYYYLDEFVNLMYDELGVSTRISTVGYSRHNEFLNNMHKRINSSEILRKLAGVRISFTPYAIGWNISNKEYSKYDYIMDIANILRIYKCYYDYAGAGSRQMCVELRYKPLVVIGKVYDEEMHGHRVIAAGHHVYISEEQHVNLNTSFISNPYEHKIELSEKPVMFYDVAVNSCITTYNDVMEVVDKFLKCDKQDINDTPKLVSVHKMENSDGYYYTVNPSISEFGNYGVNIYPVTNRRINSGIIITERFALNAILQVKHEHGLESLEDFEEATWEDVYKVLNILIRTSCIYEKKGEVEKSEYIVSEVIPLLHGYILALQFADYSPKDFFNVNFSIDTGSICNLGGALREFKGLTFLENEPLTPTHERNYGKYNSTMTKEKEVFRISCEYDNKLLVQQLNLSKTATREGQVEFSKSILLRETDETYDLKSLTNNYLVPGQRRKT